VLTLQPEQPLRRTYSIANVPRPDGLLRLHVRAVTGGLVSPVLEALISAPDPGRHREIVLYYGARRHPDLYDLPALREYDLAP
jgi:NAD(P)H-flavin reductase